MVWRSNTDIEATLSRLENLRATCEWCKAGYTIRIRGSETSFILTPESRITAWFTDESDEERFLSQLKQTLVPREGEELTLEEEKVNLCGVPCLKLRSISEMEAVLKREARTPNFRVLRDGTLFLPP